MNSDLLIPCFKRFSSQNYHGHANRVLRKLLLRAKKKYSSMGNQCKNSHILFINFSTKKGPTNPKWSGSPQISAGFLHSLFTCQHVIISVWIKCHSLRKSQICRDILHDVENERFAVVCSRCRQNLKFGNFTLSFGRLRRRIFCA